MFNMPVSRRALLTQIAAAAMVGPVTLEAAQHVHEAAAAAATTAGGLYKPKGLTQHEFDSLKALCEIIVPGASKGGAAEFIDLLSSQNPEMAAIYTGGLAWLDEEMRKQYHTDFLAASAEQKTGLLDKIAYRKNRTDELAPGIKFFEWARYMTVDAYYTSAVGIKEVGFMGNRPVKEFKVPQEAIDYAVKRSPFA
jgi:gluconate 2-dehydrogenase gamma chain